jgi:hypothetical protein
MGSEHEAVGRVLAAADKPQRLKGKRKALGVLSAAMPRNGSDSILWLQSAVGNHAISRIFPPPPPRGTSPVTPVLQRKASDGSNTRADTAEAEPEPAARAPFAAAVSSAAAPNDRSAPPNDGAASRSRAGSSVIAVGPGQALPASLAARFSAAFGHDLADVRIEASSLEARRLGARAFTRGRHVAFGPGEFQPGTAEGLRLLGHELAHVVQQSRGAGAVQLWGDEGRYEREADRAAEQALAGHIVQPLSGLDGEGAALQRAPTKTIDWTHGIVEEQYETERKRVLLFDGQPWVTVKWHAGGWAKIDVEPFLYSGGIVRVSVRSDAWLDVTVDATAEEAILAANRDKFAAGAAYEFVFHGTVKVAGGASNLSGSSTLSPPVRRVVGESTADDTIVIPREGDFERPPPRFRDDVGVAKTPKAESLSSDCCHPNG